jgi:hypothetical protein
VTYLVIFFVVASAGIAAIWFRQRRELRHLNTVDGFRSSLEKISTHQVRAPGPRMRLPDAAPRARSRRPEPLDPARREAARRRLERRRAALRAQ